MKEKVVIIGGGVAGLSAGIYSAMNGFDTEIYEMHSVAGGQCTAWDRDRFRFDYCLHWLVGTSKGPFHEIWRETNVLNDQTEIIDHEIHSQIIDNKGERFTIYADINRWEEYLLKLSPEDEKPIRSMCREMRKSARLEPFTSAPELRSPLEYLRLLPSMIPLMFVVQKFGRLTCAEYFDKLNFKSEKIRTAFHSLYGDRNFSALAFIFMLGWFNQKNAGYIKGGSYPLAQRMRERYESLGGRIVFRKRVEKIIVEKNIAKGIVLTDGTVIKADHVISAADGFSTIYKMLDGKYTSKQVEHAYKNWELFPPLVQVSFGVGKEVKADAPILLNFSKGVKIGMTELEYGFSLMNYSYDNTMAPEGKTTIVMRYESPWKLWENLEGEAYRAEKEQIKKDAVACLESIHPGISGSIEVIDVATPKTDVKYTGVKDGAYEGFLPTRENMMKGLRMQLPGLKNFYMAGQWLFPGGGLPPSAQTGKWAVQMICKKKRQKFISNR
ncbi:MAG TPA: NAD(P)/FAD-dependent oxidoreductase [Bacteroidales bacterium]|nr:NAD(P)/FAD-dependent oxidoreductase [Bacteroidales bacterium]HPI86685.1 NAD(P)/FAD-dependent oxidoreductase [Bacteroidales bacterium]HPM93291.1 NAD(P)/FAD-dependent oxidoreductase [Bacteroidales bacterium]